MVAGLVRPLLSQARRPADPARALATPLLSPELLKEMGVTQEDLAIVNELLEGTQLQTTQQVQIARLTKVIAKDTLFKQACTGPVELLEDLKAALEAFRDKLRREAHSSSQQQAAAAAAGSSSTLGPAVGKALAVEGIWQVEKLPDGEEWVKRLGQEAFWALWCRSFCTLAALVECSDAEQEMLSSNCQHLLTSVMQLLAAAPKPDTRGTALAKGWEVLAKGVMAATGRFWVLLDNMHSIVLGKQEDIDAAVELLEQQ